MSHSLVRLSSVIGILAVATACGAHGTASPPGDAARWDPVAHMPEVAAFAGEGATWVGLRATGVRSDGTMDLQLGAARAKATYQFVREVPPPADAPPVGAGGSLDGRYSEAVTVEVYAPFTLETESGADGTGISWAWWHLGMKRSAFGRPSAPGEAVISSGCDPAKLWAPLAAQGAPADAEAELVLDPTGGRVAIAGTPLEVKIDAACSPVVVPPSETQVVTDSAAPPGDASPAPIPTPEPAAPPPSGVTVAARGVVGTGSDASGAVGVAFKRAGPRLRQCYENALKGNPSLSVRAEARVVFATDGDAKSVEVTGAPEPFSGCLKASLLRSSVGHALDAEVSAVVPLVFQPG